MMKILVANAWPYANGHMHIGHIAAFLPGDILARYHRQKGDDVYFVSGTDCHGTPVAIKAGQEHTTPEKVSDDFHEEFSRCFKQLGFSYDMYGKTSSDVHKQFVTDYHRTMYNSEYIYEKVLPQAYCARCDMFLADRYVTGRCPACMSAARGDQCDACGRVLEPEQLSEPKCGICGDTPEFREAKHLFIAISKLEKELTEFLASRPHWRKNAVSFTKKYITEGLRDRAVTRDLKWGISVPKDGYEDKTIYIWAENVLGYLSMSYAAACERGESFAELWGENARHYYVHGKDNIPFHTVILPSLLIANRNGGGPDWHLPDDIISCEFMTLEGRKISTSENWAVWTTDVVGTYDPDSLRYFLTANGPERRDTDFTWREYVLSHNGELLGAYGNFVNRTLAFVYKYFDAVLPGGEVDAEIKNKTESLYAETGLLIENGRFREALDGIFEFVRFGNRYYDARRPWEARTADIASCGTTMYNCAQMIANLAVLLEPFLPFSSAKIFGWLGVLPKWRPVSVPAGAGIPRPEILFERLDTKIIGEETARLGGAV